MLSIAYSRLLELDNQEVSRQLIQKVDSRLQVKFHNVEKHHTPSYARA